MLTSTVTFLVPVTLDASPNLLIAWDIVVNFEICCKLQSA